jgi:hypothetical protein
MQEPFFDLPSISLEDKLDGFLLDTEFYEKEIAKRNGGLMLDKIKVGSVSRKDIEHYKRIVPHHSGNAMDLSGLRRIAEPFAKRMDSKDELISDILKAYQVGYAHYVLAKNYHFENGDRSFPFGNCGPSSRSALASLWLHGFHHATYASYVGEKMDHGYVMLPFVMDGFSGVIIMDPTSDQLGKHKGAVRRNLVTIKQGLDWEYITEYDSGANLFPKRVLHLGTLLQERAVNPYGDLDDGRKVEFFRDGRRFLDLAYSNPVGR